MSKISDIEYVINKYKNFTTFSGNEVYDDGFEAGVLSVVTELESLPEVYDHMAPNRCGDCKFIRHYKHGVYERNPHSCCELIWFLDEVDYKVDELSRDSDCPLLGRINAMR